MDKSETIHERITQLVNTFGKGKNTAFASLIGSNEANVRGYKTSVMPKFDFLEKIARSIDINLKWLLTGEESMLHESATPSSVLVSASSDAVVLRLMDKLDEKDTLLKEKDAENKQLQTELRSIEKELVTLKAQIGTQKESQAPDHPPLALGGGFIESFTSESSGGSVKESLPMRSPTTSLKKSSAAKT